MKCILVSVIVILGCNQIPFTRPVLTDHTDAVPSEVLKKQVGVNIKQEQAASTEGTIEKRKKNKSPDIEYEYFVDPDKPITPLTQNRVKKRSRSVSKKDDIATNAKISSKSKEFSLKPFRTKTETPKGIRKPLRSYYRRDLDQTLNHPVQEIHCLDLLTPYLMGDIKHNGTFKSYSYQHHRVLRLLYLISQDTKDSTKEELYSLLYQISQLSIRLFQWDMNAIRLLVSQIIQDKVHSFRNLKQGIKRLLSKWHLEFGNVTNLLRATKIFRPPCIETSELTGSTRTSIAKRYTRSTTAKRTCGPIDEDCDK